MADFKPHLPYNVPAFLLVPTIATVKGVPVKEFKAEEKPFYCSFRSFGGTETVVNGVTVVENTASIETYYDPRIKSGCNIRVGDLDYEILGTPENVGMFNKWLVFKVRALKGGA